MSEAQALNLQPLSLARRADAVFDQLKSRILSGAMQAGARLPNERELALALGVNRASVREALKRLEFLELIEVRHGQGNFIRELSGSSALQLVETLVLDPRTVTIELVRQLLEFRRHVSTQVVELAARNHTEEQLARARALVSREEEAGRDPEVALEVDLSMNALLGEASGNLLYQIVTNLFTKLLRRLGPLYYNDRRDYRRSLETHRQLLAALTARDAERAREILGNMHDYSEAAILDEVARLEAAGLLGPDADAGV